MPKKEMDVEKALCDITFPRLPLVAIAERLIVWLI
jgi:hypothetical protein